MTTLINEATRLRLIWCADQLAKLNDNGWIRLDGETVFRAMRDELADINRTAVEPDTSAKALYVMSPDQVDQVVDRVVGAIPAATDPEVIVTALTAAIEASDVAVIDAIAQTRADVLAAMPTGEPATEPSEQ